MSADQPTGLAASDDSFDEDEVFGPELARIRKEVAELHKELVRYGLVVWTAGNVSGRIR